jgi:hypothetical protein
LLSAFDKMPGIHGVVGRRKNRNKRAYRGQHNYDQRRGRGLCYST